MQFVCTPMSYAAEEQDLVRFDQESIIRGTNNLKGPGFEVSTGADGIYEEPDTMSAKWTQVGSGDHYDLKLTEQAEDWSDYENLSVRVYSPEASGAVFQLVLFEGGGTYSWVGGKSYSRYSLVADWSGWKTVHIPLKDFEGKLKLTAVNGIGFTNGGWGAPYTLGATIYLSRIFLSRTSSEPEQPTPPPAPPVDYDAELGMRTIAEFVTAADVVKIGNLTADLQITRMHDVSARWADIKKTVVVNMPPDGQDLSGYQYFNFWAYAEEATNDTVYAIFFDTNNAYYKSTFSVNWKGWKLLSLPFPPADTRNNPDICKIKNVTLTGAFYATDQPSEETKLNFEKIWMSRDEITPPASIGVFPAVGDTQITAGDTVAAFVFNTYLSAPVSNDAVTVTEDGQPLEDYTAAATRNRLSVSFRSQPGCEYAVSVKPEMLYDVYGQLIQQPGSTEFTVDTGGLIVDRISFVGDEGILAAMPESGTVTAASAVENQSASAQSAALFLAAYGEDGAIEAAALSDAVTLAPGEQKPVSVSIAADDYAGCRLAAFFLHPETFAPIAVCAYYLTESGLADSIAVTQTPAAAQTLSMDAVTLSTTGQLDVSGAAADDIVSLTVLLVRGEEGQISMLTPVQPNADGAVSYSYPLGRFHETSGRYAASLISKEAHASALPFYFADLQSQQQLVQDVTAAADTAAMEAVINANKDLFFDGAFDQEAVTHLAGVLFEQKPYADYPAIMETCLHARALLADVNEKNWSHYSALFQQETAFLFADRTAYDALLALNKDAQAAALMALEKRKPFVSFSDLRSKLNVCVIDAKKGTATLPSGGTGGGSSGGSGSGIVKSSGVHVPEVAPLPIPSESPKTPFTDLAGAAWAEADINALYQAGIVSPAADGCFRPSDLVRREEWIKLLVEAFQLPTQDVVCTYADVGVEDWFYPYVAAASEKGIVNGYGNACFGSGDNITRQDMAVLAYRFVQTMEKQLGAGQPKEAFADADQISDYAVQAVAALQQAGVLAGLEDGSFQPNGYATRAQAAALLNRMLRQIS